MSKFQLNTLNKTSLKEYDYVDEKDLSTLYSGFEKVNTMKDYVDILKKTPRSLFSQTRRSPLTKDIYDYIQRISYKYTMPLKDVKTNRDVISVFDIVHPVDDSVSVYANEELTPEKLDKIEETGVEIENLLVYRPGINKDTKIDRQYIKDVLEKVRIYKAGLNESTVNKKNMKQTQKLDELIKKIIKEELDEKKLSFFTPDGTDKVLTTAQKDELKNAKAGDSVSFKKAGSTMEEEKSEEMEVADTEVLENAPKASEIAGQVAEIMEKLKSMAEGEDAKKGKHAAKVMKYMESAKAALEALTAHETMLEEKDQAAKEKDAQGHLKAIEKHLGKIVKDKDAVGKMMKKMPIEKVIAMKDKMADKPMDEEKLARVMLKHSLKEGWVKKKPNLKEAQYVEYMHILNDLLDPNRIAHLAKHADQIQKTIILLGGMVATSKFLADKIYNLLNKAKKPGAVKPEEVEKIKDDIQTVYDKAPEKNKELFGKQIQAIEKQVAESFLKKK